MHRTTTAAVFAAAVTGASGVAFGGYAHFDEGPIVAREDSIVTMSLISRSAGWDGELSLINVDVEVGQPETTFILSNQLSERNRLEYVGQFDAGEALLFQYEIVRGTANVFRMDDEVGLDQFRHQWVNSHTARLYVEDIKLPGGDRDYNDAVYELNFRTVPTPGALAAAATGLAFIGGRRRR